MLAACFEPGERSNGLIGSTVFQLSLQSITFACTLSQSFLCVRYILFYRHFLVQRLRLDLVPVYFGFHYEHGRLYCLLHSNFLLWNSSASILSVNEQHSYTSFSICNWNFISRILPLMGWRCMKYSSVDNSISFLAPSPRKPTRVPLQSKLGRWKDAILILVPKEFPRYFNGFIYIYYISCMTPTMRYIRRDS